MKKEIIIKLIVIFNILMTIFPIAASALFAYGFISLVTYLVLILIFFLLLPIMIVLTLP